MFFLSSAVLKLHLADGEIRTHVGQAVSLTQLAPWLSSAHNVGVAEDL